MCNDSVIKRDIEEELAYDAGVDASSVEVSVFDGVVHLVGHTDSVAEKVNAERMAARVVGVRTVLNDLRVSLRPEDERTDEELATACAFTLHQLCDMPPTVRARVNHGWATLEGTVNTQSQRQTAETAVAYLVGLRGIFNHIVVCRSPLREVKGLASGSGYWPLPFGQPPMACY